MITFNSGCSGAVVENSQLPEHLPWSHRAQLLAFLSHLDATVWTAEETKPSLNAWNNRSIITSKNVLYRNISSGHCRQYRYHMYQYWRQCPELNQERCTKSSPLFHIIVQRSILPVTPAPHCCSTIYSGKPLIYYTGPIHHHSQTNYYYCYSHYVGLPAKRLSCLQRAMHSAALLSWRIPKVEYVTSYTLDVLHRLPLQQWISHWIPVACFGLAQVYVRDLCFTTLSTPCKSLFPINWPWCADLAHTTTK